MNDYFALAAIFHYPSLDYPERLALAWAALAGSGKRAAADAVRRFSDETRDMSLTEIEELFTGTFDLNPVAALDIGWHLYGEAYERGRLLAQLRELCVKHGIEEGSELPDHLATILCLLGEIDTEERRRLVTGFVTPALAKMTAPLEKSGNPYRHLLAAAAEALAGESSRTLAAVPAPSQEARA